MFRPLLDAVDEALVTEPLIPVAGGGYGVSVDLALGDSGCARFSRPVSWASCAAPAGRSGSRMSPSPSISPRCCGHYLREEIGIDEITPEAVVSLLTGEFLGAQSDEWITRLYAFLFARSALWREARAKPVIRLEDGSQVRAVRRPGPPGGLPARPAVSSLPTVRRAIAGSPGARRSWMR